MIDTLTFALNNIRLPLKTVFKARLSEKLAFFKEMHKAIATACIAMRQYI